MKKMNCIITAFIVFILQAAVLPFIFNGVSQPNLIFVFVVLMGLHHGQDVIIGNFFGLHLLVYLIVTLVCSYLGRNIDKDQWILTLLIVLGATEAGLILTCGFLFLAGQYINVAAYLLEFSIPVLVYHGILALPVDHVVWRLRRADTFYGFPGYRW